MSQVTRQNVVLIIPNLDFGGAQESFSKLSVGLAATCNVVNVVFNKDNMAAYPFGGPLIDMNIPAGGNFAKKIYNLWKRAKLLKKIKAEHQANVAISFLEGADYVNVLSRQQEKIILNIRGSKLHDQNISGWLGFLRHRFLLPWLYQRADHVVVLNKGIENELQQFYKLKKPVSVIYNGFDLAALQQLSKAPVEDALLPVFDSPLIVSHGRLSWEKGYEPFLTAFSVVKKSVPDCKFLLIGDGPEKEKLMDTCNMIGLKTWTREEQRPLDQTADVFFLGYDSNPQKYLSRASLFVLPSYHEGFGNAVAEAMASGLPVVAADCPYSPREILSPSTSPGQRTEAEWAPFGILLPMWQLQSAQKEWASVICKLLLDTELRWYYAKKATERVHDFTLSKMLKAWQELI